MKLSVILDFLAACLVGPKPTNIQPSFPKAVTFAEVVRAMHWKDGALVLKPFTGDRHV